MSAQLQRNYRAPGNPFFRTWAAFVLRYKWQVIGVNLVLTGMMLYQIVLNLKVDNGTEAFVGDEAEEVVVLEALYDDFGQDRIYQILVAGDVFSMDYLNRLKKLHREMAAIDLDIPSRGYRKAVSRERRAEYERKNGDAGDFVPEKRSPKQTDDDGFGAFEAAGGPSNDTFAGFEDDDGWGEERGGTIIEEVTSLVNARETTWENGGLKVAGLLDRWPTEAELPALRRKVLADKRLVGRVIGKDGRHSVVILRADFMNERDSRRLFEHISTLSKKHNAEGFKVMVSGHPAFDATLDILMLADFQNLTLVATLVMVFLSALIFRHPMGVLGPLLVVMQSAIWTLGGMALTDTPMTIVTNVIPAFLACVGVGDAVHIQSVYRDARARGMDNNAAIVHAVATTGIPVLYTSITTGLGLISFKLATLGAIEDMGVFGALGIVCALIQSLVFLPVLLSFNTQSLLGVRPNRGEGDILDAFLGFCNRLSRSEVVNGRASRRRAWTVVIASIALMLVAAGGASMLTMFHDPLTWIPPDREIRQSMNEMDAHVGGTASIALLIEAKNGEPLKNRDFLLKLEKLEAYIRGYKDPKSGDGNVVGATISVLDIIKESWRAVNGEKAAYYEIPDTERGVDDMITLFENAAPEQLKRLATVDMMKLLMTVRVKWMDAGSYAPLTAYVDEGVAKFIGDAATVRITGTVRMVFMVISTLLTDLVKSFGMAFLTVTIVMIFLLRGIKLGLVSMVPNLMPVVAVMGIMGFASIPLDMANLIIASIIIGIAVDDTIHFLHQFRMHYIAHEEVDAALDHAFAHTGRAMVATSAMLVLGFLVFLTAGIYPLQRFGILTGTAIVFAFFFDVIVSPALLRIIYGKKERKQTSE